MASMIDADGILAQIVEAWSEDSNNDVGRALIQEASTALELRGGRSRDCKEALP